MTRLQKQIAKISLNCYLPKLVITSFHLYDSEEMKKITEKSIEFNKELIALLKIENNAEGIICSYK